MEQEKIKTRIRFQKTGASAFISHLDLMRTLGRALSRAEIPAAKTNGFNPHAYISIPCALSLGYEGTHEMAEIGLPPSFDPALIPERINPVLPRGILVTGAYPIARKSAEIAFAEYDLLTEGGADAGRRAAELLRSGPLVVMKKSKRNEEEKDISPLIRAVEATEEGFRATVVCSASENLNPRLLLEALKKLAPEEDFRVKKIRRGRFFDQNGEEFR
ncbi:MAG: TIGR03936 family radical SAM-associated protein [Clostridia bacterium]|nr:TIGR03936 family radical SAM-associated protein [Clostridia bacterium]